jgi:hypothetical protein
VGVYAYRRRCETWRSTFVFLGSVVSVFSLLFSLFVFTLGTGYHTDPLDRRLGMPSAEISRDALYDTALWLTEEVNQAAGGVDFASDGFSVMPYELDVMTEKLLEAYGAVSADYPFIQSLNSRIKPVLASKAMSHTHITGVYTYYTGEANVNVAYPAYNVIFTAAHELSHQRGVLRENEANFMAYLVNSASDDPNLRYSAALNMLEYIASALYRTCPDRYFELIAELCETARADITASGEVSRRYGDTVFSDISRFVNDLFLKSNGTPGVVSYGMVTELAIDYFKSEGRIPSNDQ